MDRNPIAGETIVRCSKQSCVLKGTDEGVHITPGTSPDPAVKCFCCYRKITEISLKREEVVGAECLTHSAFRIYYAVAIPTRCPFQHSEFRLKKTCSIDCGRGIAERMARSIQRWALTSRQDESERKILFLVNPKSGKGKALSVFQNKVRPFIRNVSGWKSDDFSTQHKGHATEIIQNADLSRYAMIGVVGGDGTIHEALQGLLNRKDWHDHTQIPLVPFPVGTGNALATSIGIGSIDTALVAIAKGCSQDMDILSVRQNKSRTWSFLGVMYGALSTIDIDSEVLRCLGDFRFTIGAIRELIRMQSFRIKIAYLPFEEGQAATSRSIGVEDVASGLPDQPAASPSTSTVGHDTLQDRQSALRSPDTRETGVLGESVLDWFSKSTEDGMGPDCWVMHHDYDTRLMAALNLPFIAKNSHFMPTAGLSDGALHLLLCPTHLSNRSQMLKLFLKSEKGRHLGLDSVHCEKIKALIFSPEQNTSLLTVDGEVVPSDLITVEVCPRLIKVISLPPSV